VFEIPPPFSPADAKPLSTLSSRARFPRTVARSTMNASERNHLLNTQLVGKVRLEGVIYKMPVDKPLKHGKEKDWKERYFVLADNVAYFPDEKAFKSGKKPKGVICLDFATVEQNPSDPLVFVLRTPHKTIAIKTNTIPDSERWIRAFRSVTVVDQDEEDESVKALLYGGGGKS